MTRRLVTTQPCEFGSIPNGKLTKLFWEHADWSKAWPDRGFRDPRLEGDVRNYCYLHVPSHDADEEDGSGFYCDLCRDERGWAGTSHRLYPRVHPGDLLWVKERAWDAFAPSPKGDPGVVYLADYGNKPGLVSEREALAWSWRASFLMPKVWSRPTLKVTAVRIERLQDISEADAIAEGVEAISIADVPRQASRSNRQDFSRLWVKLHGPGSWEANPWVTVTTFDLIKAEYRRRRRGTCRGMTRAIIYGLIAAATGFAIYYIAFPYAIAWVSCTLRGLC